MGQLTGKTALVTGGSSGIGLATAQRFAAEGAHVFLTGRNQETIDKAVASIGESATGIRSDVSDDRDLDKVFDAINARGHGLDVVFANAGGGAEARRLGTSAVLLRSRRRSGSRTRRHPDRRVRDDHPRRHSAAAGLVRPARTRRRRTSPYPS